LPDWGTVQNSQQFTSQLHEQEAAVQTAQENLNQAPRQVAVLKAQRMSANARAQLSQAQVNLRRTRILSPVDGYVTNLLGAARRLRQCRREHHLACRRRLILGRRAVALTIT
jgi:multidrug resistance efflux pump